MKSFKSSERGIKSGRFLARPFPTSDVSGGLKPIDAILDRLAAIAHWMQSEFNGRVPSVEVKRPLGEFDSSDRGHRRMSRGEVGTEPLFYVGEHKRQ